MFLFFIFFVEICFGGYIDKVNETMPTIDGGGTIINTFIGGVLLKNPSSPYQNIDESSSGYITIRSSSTAEQINNPIIVLDKQPKIVKNISGLELFIKIRHQLLNVDQGLYYFSVIMVITKQTNSEKQQIQIRLSSNSPCFESTETHEEIVSNNKTYQYQQKMFCLKQIKSQFQSTISLQNFTRKLLQQSIVSEYDILKEVIINFRLANGSHMTSLSYKLKDNVTKVYKQQNFEVNNLSYQFSFKPAIRDGNFQYLTHSSKKNLVTYFRIPKQNSEKTIQCNGEQINTFYNKMGHFPLDPALQTRFSITSSTQLICDFLCIVPQCFAIVLRRDFDLQTNSFMRLFDENQVSNKIYICTKAAQELQLGMFIEEVIYTEGANNTVYKLFIKLNSTAEQPSIYTFVSNLFAIPWEYSIDIFYFIKKLFLKGRFRSHERISEISRCIGFIQGKGSFNFGILTLPNKSDLSYQGSLRCPSSMFGCLVCTDNQTCSHCDISEHWVLQNQKCKCKFGFFLKKKQNLNICIRIQTKKSLSCLLGESTTEECLTAQLPFKAQVALSLTSTPNIGMILKISQLVCLVDDFMFYVYINMTYGEEFEKFLYLMWNMSIERWVPASLSSFYYDIQGKSDEIITATNVSRLPELWLNLNQDSNFIRNTQKFWISSVPLTICIFLFAHSLYRLLRRLNIKFSFRLIKFKWFNIMFVGIFLQNIQLLSFRAFQQIFYVGSTSEYESEVMHFISQLVSYSTLFFIFICACAGQYIVKILIGSNINHALIDIVRYNGTSIWFMIIIQLIQFTKGFVYANSFFDDTVKITILFCIQTGILVLIVFYRKYFRRKTMLVLLITEYVLRVVIHVCLILTVWLRFHGHTLTLIQEQTLDRLQITII